MNQFLYHLQTLPRLFRHPFPVRTIIYQPHKTVWCNGINHSLDISLILRGEGHFYMNHKHWRVKAPCVLIESPGIPMRYGPDKEWEEVSIIYDARRLTILKKIGVLPHNKPVWPLHNTSRLHRLLPWFYDCVQDRHAPGGADHLDSICELILKECWLAHTSAAVKDQNEAVIRTIRATLDLHYLEKLDIFVLARQHGLSPSNLRKQWRRSVNCPPGRYVMQLRMQEACRLLTETQKSIKEIAAKLHFEDPLYFYKKFHHYTGQTASSFRAMHSIYGRRSGR